MKLARRKFLQLTAGAAALPTVLRIAWAQTYPSRPIKLVIPFPPGGVNDAIGRPWADRMKALLGTVVIENIGGAGGTLGVAGVARAQPDGYTLVLGNAGNMVVAPAAATRPLYDPLRDFEAIYNLASGAGVFAVHPSLPTPTLKALVDYVKANQNKLSYGSPGVGTGNHLAVERFKRLIEAPDIVHIPYRGAGPLLTDLIGGQITFAAMVMTGQVLALHKSGKLRVLAVTAPARVQGAPDFPTTVEAGFTGITSPSLFGLFAPKGTPRPIVEQIAKATRTSIADPDLQRLYITSGFEPHLDSSPEALRREVAEELVRWTPVIKEMGLKLD
jgi:tripartite-type tricarboxylate transporter receptor subunit TctC